MIRSSNLLAALDRAPSVRGIAATQPRSLWLAAPMLTTGLAALVVDHLEPGQSLAYEMRAVWALATAGIIAWVLTSGARSLVGRPALELHQYTRLVTRWVYILIYVLAIARVVLYLFESYYGSQAHSLARPMDDFQFYVCCAVIPLWVVRTVVRLVR